jgi:hypothetical protein
MADAVVIVGELSWELRQLRARAMGRRIPVRVVEVNDEPMATEAARGVWEAVRRQSKESTP